MFFSIQRLFQQGHNLRILRNDRYGNLRRQIQTDVRLAPFPSTTQAEWKTIRSIEFLNRNELVQGKIKQKFEDWEVREISRGLIFFSFLFVFFSKNQL